MSFQHFPYPPPSASGGPPSALTGSHWCRQQQEAEEPPQLYEPFVANYTTPIGNEGSSAVFKEVRRYLRIRELDLKGLHISGGPHPAHGD